MCPPSIILIASTTWSCVSYSTYAIPLLNHDRPSCVGITTLFIVPKCENISCTCSFVTFLVSMFTLTLVGFGVGERLRRLGEALRDRRPPLVELLLDLRPPLGEGLLDLLPPLPLELERLLLGDRSLSFSVFTSEFSLSL